MSVDSINIDGHTSRIMFLKSDIVHNNFVYCFFLLISLSFFFFEANFKTLLNYISAYSLKYVLINLSLPPDPCICFLPLYLISN